MLEAKSLINSINDITLRSNRQSITARNALVRNIFSYLYRQQNMFNEPLILCSEHGLVLHAFAPDFEEDLSGYTLSFDAPLFYRGQLIFHDGPGYRIISSSLPESIAAVSHLQADLNAMLKIFDENESESRYLLNCLDSIRNSISIYDKDAHLLFANKHFCKYFRIDNREAVIGMNVRDIMNLTGIKVISIEGDSSNLKMMEVLKSGKEALDWEVRIESGDAPNRTRLASNDMYPVLGKDGEIQGMAELARSHQQDMKRTRKILGLAAEYSFNDIIGTSPAIQDKIKLAKEYARNPFNFLLTGESGVGKELFAQSIHNCSANVNGPFVALNCASIPDGLIESELFGYVGGAFTGASKNGQVGKFELADGGTLFLDEIGELPYHFQSKLLRVLETWTVTRVGSSQEIPINVRVIAATNRNLDEMVSEGLFRQDLYYRLQVLSIEIPPLRERGEDILLLAKNFLKQFLDVDTGAVKTLDADTQKALLEYDWPGNVRELRNVINRIAILSKEQTITRDILEASIYSKRYALKQNINEAPEDRLNKRKKEVEASYANLLKEALAITNGNKKRAAEVLGVSRKTFYRMLERYDAHKAIFQP